MNFVAKVHFRRNRLVEVRRTLVSHALWLFTLGTCFLERIQAVESKRLGMGPDLRQTVPNYIVQRQPPSVEPVLSGGQHHNESAVVDFPVARLTARRDIYPPVPVSALRNTLSARY
jgi:hypothetical protein